MNLPAVHILYGYLIDTHHFLGFCISVSHFHNYPFAGKRNSKFQYIINFFLLHLHVVSFTINLLQSFFCQCFQLSTCYPVKVHEASLLYHLLPHSLQHQEFHLSSSDNSETPHSVAFSLQYIIMPTSLYILNW